MQSDWKKILQNVIVFFIYFFIIVSAVYFLLSYFHNRTSFDWDAFTKLYISFFPPALTIIVALTIFYFDKRNQEKKHLEFAKEVLAELQKHKLNLVSLTELNFMDDIYQISEIKSDNIQYLFESGKLYDLGKELFDVIVRFINSKKDVNNTIANYKQIGRRQRTPDEKILDNSEASYKINISSKIVYASIVEFEGRISAIEKKYSEKRIGLFMKI